MSDAWRPIETAPKDGTRILGAIPLNKARVRIYWWSESQFRRLGNGWDFEGNGLDSPTHWMPRPPPLGKDMKDE